jgi:hypothetical protein
MSNIYTIIAASTQYTFLVFGAGFLCGMIRVPFMEPMLGERTATLFEMPIMLFAMWRSARFIVARLGQAGWGGAPAAAGDGDKPGRRPARIDFVVLGFLSLLQILAAEMGLYVWVHWHEGKTLANWAGDRDPVAGTAFFAMLGLYALLPAWIAPAEIG